ncbi:MULTISPECIES: cation diffusion facilitator family transporter [unclassified Parafrankia]|uniref:cation diffusion facilitator family transporter n=1 Tax=unclassified Parafrankia TaxID=2994368 RepID=UPI000DA468C5|nr:MULTISPECIES: cation diffusion facilitator family transporter [unclassified Parafrankia]TCJ33806.1 cation transporter [Parafrankia sp. BMG5.11]SQD96251.1 Cation diffusion facilitator family transporter [Parafrankia sp. Ea1.12]
MNTPEGRHGDHGHDNGQGLVPPQTRPAHGHDSGHTHAHGGPGAPGGHEHAAGRSAPRGFDSQRRRLAFATGLNVAIVVGQAAAGLLVGSVALLADAAHNLVDAAGVAFALMAIRLARQAPSATRTFGGLRWPVLAAQANAASVLVVTTLVCVEAAGRLAHPEPVDGLVVLIVAIAAAVGNGVSALFVHERHGDLNTRAAVTHLAGDALVSVAVAGAGLVIWLTGGWYWLDPALSLVVAALIGIQGVRLLAESSRVLLEATPAGLDLAAVQADVLAVEGVTGVHDVHVWGLSDRVAAASAHVEVAGHPTLEEARAVSDRVKAVLAEKHGVVHATVETECEPCSPAGGDPCDVRRVTVHQLAPAHRH